MKPYRRAENRYETMRAIAERHETINKEIESLGDPKVDTFARKIRFQNEGLKRINGHSPEYVAASLNATVDQVFPPDGKTIYIGDPWQKLDRKGVVIVDYEFGPVVEFQDDKEKYLVTLNHRLGLIQHERKYLENKNITDFLDIELKLAWQLYKNASREPLINYEKISNEFILMQLRVEKFLQHKTGGEEDGEDLKEMKTVNDLWYAAVHGARAVDVLDWERHLKDDFMNFVSSLSDMSNPDDKKELADRKKRKLIESIRLKKTAAEAHVVQAMFPFLPFKDESFDSFVAFWSISTYVFPHLSPREMTGYWEEINRVLKKGGVAYISPIFNGNENTLYSTLYGFQKEHPNFVFEFFYEEDADSPYILVINKKLNDP